jgi:PPE-repeat protein
MLSLTKVRFVARVTLIAAFGGGCGGQGASGGTGTAAGGAAVGSGGAFQVGAGGSSSATGDATGMSGASGGQKSSVGASGGTVATGVAGANAAGAPTGGSSGSGGTLAAGSGGTLVAGSGGNAGAGGANAGAGGSGSTTSGAGVTVTITPGSVWQDTQGNVIQAHGEGIIKVGTTYYWLGEDKTNGSAFQNVKCYSSSDLAHWAFVNNVLTRQASGDLGPNRVIERPHVIYNAASSQFVMHMSTTRATRTARPAWRRAAAFAVPTPIWAA